MLLLVVLLAHVVPPADAPPIIPSGNIADTTLEDTAGTQLGDIAGLHKTWEDLNLACRNARHDSPEGDAICLRRDLIRWQMGQLGWCLRNEGLQIKWEMCPRTGR